MEEDGTPPEIETIVTKDSITVADRGPGIAPATVEWLVDYSSRTTSRAAYVSPSRGAQGNALQTILAMPFALSEGQQGEVLIESQGVAHKIRFAIDSVRQTPDVSRSSSRPR